MKGPSKLLLLKNHRERALARSWIVDDGGLHGRTIADSGALHSALQRERFDVVVIDQRQSDDDLIETLSGVRQFQADSRLLVLSEKVALPQVIQAMRFGVRDIFQPPIDIPEFILRVHADVTGEPVRTRGRDDQEVFARWEDLTQSLEGTRPSPAAKRAEPPKAPPPSPLPEPPPPPPGVSHEAQQEITSLRTALEDQRRETEMLRRKLDEAHAAHARLSTEVDRHINHATTAHVGPDARVQQLEREIAELKEERERRTPPPPATDGRVAELQKQLEAAQERVRALEAAPSSAKGTTTSSSSAPARNDATAAELLAVQQELEFYINNAAKLQEQLAQAAVANAEVTKELARLGSIEAKSHRFEAQLSASKLEHAHQQERTRKLEQQIQATEDLAAEMEAKFKAASAELEARDSALAQATASAEAATKATAAAREAQAKAEATSNTERTRATEMESRITAERKQIAERETAARKALDEAAKRDAETAAMLEAEQAVLENQRKKLARETDELRLQQANLAREQQELQARVEAANKRERELKETEKTLARLQSEQKADAERLAASGKKLESETARLGTEAAQLAERTKKIEEQRADIRCQLKRLHDAV